MLIPAKSAAEALVAAGRQVETPIYEHAGSRLVQDAAAEALQTALAQISSKEVNCYALADILRTIAVAAARIAATNGADEFINILTESKGKKKNA